MPLKVESVRTTRGQPGLSLFICWYTMCCERQGQPDSLLGKSGYIVLEFLYVGVQRLDKQKNGASDADAPF